MALIRVFDLETSGLEPDAEVMELGWCDLDTDTRVITSPSSYLCRVDSCPPDARAIHHIRPQDTAGALRYDRRIFYEEAARAGVDVLAAHSADHEQKYILGSIPLICTHKAALRVWPDAPAHGVFALLYWLEDTDLAEYDKSLALAATPSRGR